MLEISQIGNGTYTRANKTNVGLSVLIDELKKIDKAVLSKDRFLEYEDHYQAFLSIGFILILLYLLIPINSNSNVELNLFSE